MTSTTTDDVKIDFRLSSQAKLVIEQAAALSGQSLNDFAISTLLEKANQLLDDRNTRSLSERDAQIFLSLLDSQEEPNPALREAAAWYKENHGSLGD